MKKPSNNNEDLDSLRDKLIGLGEQSVRKSYYPEQQQRLEEIVINLVVNAVNALRNYEREEKPDLIIV